MSKGRKRKRESRRREERKAHLFFFFFQPSFQVHIFGLQIFHLIVAEGRFPLSQLISYWNWKFSALNLQWALKFFSISPGITSILLTIIENFTYVKQCFYTYTTEQYIVSYILCIQIHGIISYTAIWFYCFKLNI